MILLYLGSYYALQTRKGSGWVTMTKAGPNDTRHVIWAFGMLFF